MSAVAVVGRPINSGVFASQELTFLKMLVPHLRRAVEMNRRLEQSVRQVDLSLDILDRFRDALVLVTANATTTYCNKAAEAMFRDQASGLSVVRSRITCERPSDTAALRRSIAEAAGTAGGAVRQGGTISIEREAHPWPLTLHCLPLTHPLRGILEQQPAALLLMTDPARSFDFSPAALAQLFRFTGAEARLALHLARGETLAEAASQLGVARATLASQLNAIFQKTHTRRQSDLMRLLHTLPRVDLEPAYGELGQS
jgi:DNA-binding CsgD family transcriptional regulator